MQNVQLPLLHVIANIVLCKKYNGKTMALLKTMENLPLTSGGLQLPTLQVFLCLRPDSWSSPVL